MEKDSLLEEYYNYRPEDDPNGNYGPSIVDRLIQRYGSIEKIPKLINIKDEHANSLEKTLEILKETNPAELRNFGNGNVFDGLLKKITDTGYVIKNSYGLPINDFSIVDAPKKWGIYLDLMKDFKLLKP